ncbi:aminoglycoside phosphotransferase family protein [Streptomyces sp. enrichment culture]|uniref:aminoglycoside phosphotransferase family protein n=1 Tax=Streptomyces sp. enrichment culture TaxID=1795815 RepID=UPI003F54D486
MDDGWLWLKCTTGLARHEASLVAFLRDRLGPVVPEVVVHDEADGWFVTRGALTLPSVDGDPDRARHLWEAVLEQYGAMQREIAKNTDELIGLGVPDLRPERLMSHLDILLDRPGMNSRTELLHRIAAMRPQLEEWCARLRDTGVPASIQHDDLHLGNVLRESGGAAFVIIDWADAVVTHPFGSLLYPLYAARRRGDTPAQVKRLVDAYLSGLGQPARSAETDATITAALRLASIPRALMWQSLADITAPTALTDYYGSGAPRWLGRMADGTWALTGTEEHS